MYDYRKLSDAERAQIVEQRLLRGFPPHSPPHTVRGQPYYLITATCFNHAAYMTDPKRRTELLDLVFEALISASIGIHAWVVGLNHYHLLIEPSDFSAVGRELRFVHGTLSRAWNIADARPGRQVWYRYSDRAMRSEAHFLTTLNYIHYNPVKHHWCKSPYEWRESSVHWYFECLGQKWLRDVWVKYPLRSYGSGWDDETETPVRA